MTALIIQNEELHNIMKTVKSLEESSLLIKGISETNKAEAKEQKADFLVSYQVHKRLVYQEIY